MIMRIDRHISEQTFFSIIQTRLFRYLEAIWSNGGSVNIASAIIHNIENFKNLNSQDNFCGRGFWGYGINCISNGKNKTCMADILEIERLNILNKHHEPFRHLQVLTFKVEKRFLFVSTFSIDSCQVGLVSDINQKYDLVDFENARLLTNSQKTSVEFSLKGLPIPICFQVDDYYIPGCLSGGVLAKYYIERMKECAEACKKVENDLTFQPKLSFIDDLVGGIYQLQNQGKRAECIRVLIDESKKDEGGFRDFFQIILEAKGYSAEAEPLKSHGRIDLKVKHPELSTKILEFKGWWNADRKNIINQLNRYLTDFEDDGYIFMINHTNRNIVLELENLICKPETHYVEGTWKEIKFKNTAFTYFISKHRSNSLRTVYHFVISVY